jgi:hypothetical protein
MPLKYEWVILNTIIAAVLANIRRDTDILYKFVLHLKPSVEILLDLVSLNPAWELFLRLMNVCNPAIHKKLRF